MLKTNKVSNRKSLKGDHFTYGWQIAIVYSHHAWTQTIIAAKDTVVVVVL